MPTWASGGGYTIDVANDRQLHAPSRRALGPGSAREPSAKAGEHGTISDRQAPSRDPAAAWRAARTAARRQCGMAAGPSGGEMEGGGELGGRWAERWARGSAGRGGAASRNWELIGWNPPTSIGIGRGHKQPGLGDMARTRVFIKRIMQSPKWLHGRLAISFLHATCGFAQPGH